MTLPRDARTLWLLAALAAALLGAVDASSGPADATVDFSKKIVD